MLLNSNPIHKNTIQFNENEVLRLFANKQYAESYIILDTKVEKNICDIYNLALCCYLTKQYEKCLSYLENIKIGDLKQISMQKNIQQDEVQKLMLSFQAQTFRCFENAISLFYLNSFPNLVNDNILRLKVNSYLALNQWDNIIKTININTASAYKDLHDALELAKENIK